MWLAWKPRFQIGNWKIRGSFDGEYEKPCHSGAPNVDGICFYFKKSRYTWRIIPVSKWLVTPIDMPFRPFGRGTTPTEGTY